MHKNKLRNVRRRLSRILNSEFKQELNKSDVIKFIYELEDYCGFQKAEFNNFKKNIKNLNEESWKFLINQHNNHIKQQIEVENLEIDSFNKLVLMIEKDNVLKHHNINFGRNNFGRYEKNYFIVKTYLVCGVYLLDGTLEEIVKQIKFVLKENNVKIRVFCLACSSKKVSFMNQYCLCHNCGSIFNIDSNQVVEKYDIKDKDFWNAKFLTFRTKNAKDAS